VEESLSANGKNAVRSVTMSSPEMACEEDREYALGISKDRAERLYTKLPGDTDDFNNSSE